MSKSDLIRLRHMLEAAREAVKFVEGHTPSDLRQNPLWALGLVKCVGIYRRGSRSDKPVR